MQEIDKNAITQGHSRVEKGHGRVAYQTKKQKRLSYSTLVTSLKIR